MISSTAFSTDPTSQVTLVIGGDEVRNVTNWAASQDILMLGDPFSVTIPNPRGVWTKGLKVGSPVQLYLQNPAVQGNRRALTHTGVIVGRDVSGNLSSGSVIRLQCADRGWHLQSNCARFKSKLERVPLGDLVQKFASNPTWGFADKSGNVQVRTDDVTSRLLRRGLPPTRAQAQAAASDQLIVYRQIVEPGQTVADILMSAARRLNRLIGVAADGVLQVWNPDYSQTPLYRLDYHQQDDPDSVRNNVQSCMISETIDGIYTRVEVVGQVVGWYPTDINDLAPGKFSAVATAPNALPFDHELSYQEADVWQPSLAPSAAMWKMNRARYDSFSATYKVRGHHQNGSWWTAGTMCELHDSVNGFDGNYFVSAVKHMRSRDGDQTEVTLRLPGLLAASFNRI